MLRLRLWDFNAWGGTAFQNRAPAFLGLESRLSIADCQTRVVFGIVLLVCAVVGDAADDFFWVVPSCKGSLRVGPIALGLTQRFLRAA